MSILGKRRYHIRCITPGTRCDERRQRRQQSQNVRWKIFHGYHSAMTSDPAPLFKNWQVDRRWENRSVELVEMRPTSQRRKSDQFYSRQTSRASKCPGGHLIKPRLLNQFPHRIKPRSRHRRITWSIPQRLLLLLAMPPGQKRLAARLVRRRYDRHQVA